MGAGSSTEVLLALLDAPDDGLDGEELVASLGRHGRRRQRRDQLLVTLLRLEASGHVIVHRAGGMLRFSLSDQGRARAYELGGGQPVHVRLLMADLVGFVEFTAAHGDEAARDAAGTLATAAAAIVRAEGGEVVKGLGDGFLAWLPPATDALPVMARLAARCSQPTGTPWRLRAASHVGRPLRHGHDLFGGDVNLVARLCELARPDELVLSRPGDALAPEHLELRGMADPVPVARVAIR